MKSFLKGLGLGLLCLVLFVLGVVFNTEFLGLKNHDKQNIEFSRNIEVSNEIMPNIFNATLNFSASEELSKKTTISSNEKDHIAKTFKEISDRIAKENYCKGGSYTLEPSYNYYQEAKTLNGYKLYSNFTCQIPQNKSKDYENLIKDIESISNTNILISFNTKALQAGFDEAILETNKENLYDLALKKAFEKAQYYSKTLAKTCLVKNIHFDNNNIKYYAPNLTASTDSVVLPIVKSEKQNLKANVLFVCQ
ncbi:SIMPL domain-containing protein [Campylobacter lari]|uniref:SIMPL domain-containing protein n=1 Tax=Campylobacter lari TaxID=201 RepID=UPI002152F598|nr:SIMPL domain-containing protein [Campylobacter lari]MCR6516643.1 SIMPL domain-containing protein [Campylobacter lari]MCR6520295.1 SIMPL domain-containing protein [Campylobacter lari]